VLKGKGGRGVGEEKGGRVDGGGGCDIGRRGGCCEGRKKDRPQRKRVKMVKNAKMVENLRSLDDGKFGKRRRGRGWPASKRVKRKETREVDETKMHHCLRCCGLFVG
jgi:hypothetical protein